jgi:hypothetical protein
MPANVDQRTHHLPGHHSLSCLHRGQYRLVRRAKTASMVDRQYGHPGDRAGEDHSPVVHGHNRGPSHSAHVHAAVTG